MHVMFSFQLPGKLNKYLFGLWFVEALAEVNVIKGIIDLKMNDRREEFQKVCVSRHNPSPVTLKLAITPYFHFVALCVNN